VVLAVGLAASVLGALAGYEIGTRIGARWLGVVMALNAAVFTGLVASLAADWLIRRLASR
jgi:VIT1/CCC1 family predicted Fe2+/Mn2+ transporter